MSHLQHPLDDSRSEESSGVGEEGSGGDEGKTRNSTEHERGGEGGNGDSSEQERNRDTAAGAKSGTAWWKTRLSIASSFWNLVDEFKESEEGKMYKDREWSEEEYIAYRDFQNARTDEKNRRNSFDLPERRKSKDIEEGDGDLNVGAPANSKDIGEKRRHRGPSIMSSFWNLYEEFWGTQPPDWPDDPERDMLHLNEQEFAEYAEFASARRDDKGRRNSFDLPFRNKDGEFIKKKHLKKVKPQDSGGDKVGRGAQGRRQVDDEEKQLPEENIEDEIEEEGIQDKPDTNWMSMGSTLQEAKNTFTKDKLARIKKAKPQKLGLYDADFTERLINVAKDEMVKTLPFNGETMLALNLSTMQRMNIHAIQRDIVHFAGLIVHANGKDVDWGLLRGMMKEYCQAWRDWSMIEDFAEESMADDPFRLLTTNILSKKLMEDFDMLPSKPNNNKPDDSKSDGIKLEDFIVDWTVQDKSFLPAYARHATRGKAKIQKSLKLFAWAAGGGLSLIGPMLLMRLHRTLLTQLVTTCLAVMVFGAIVALLAGGLVPYVDPVDLGPQDVLTATAAYAAVLVVFISQDA